MGKVSAHQALILWMQGWGCMEAALGLLNPLKLVPAVKELMPLPADVTHELSVPSSLSCWASGIQEEPPSQMLSYPELGLPKPCPSLSAPTGLCHGAQRCLSAPVQRELAVLTAWSLPRPCL